MTLLGKGEGKTEERGSSFGRERWRRIGRETREMRDRGETWV